MQFYLFYYGIQAVGGIVECGVFAMSFAHAKWLACLTRPVYNLASWWYPPLAINPVYKT
jgi:hypothetical protein